MAEKPDHPRRWFGEEIGLTINRGPGPFVLQPGAPPELVSRLYRDQNLAIESVNTPPERVIADGGSSMYFVAAVLAVLSGLFYAASQHEIGRLGVEMCRYGSTFCDNPIYVLVGAILAALWGAFVSIR
jgi:hypothetical protein